MKYDTTKFEANKDFGLWQITKSFVLLVWQFGVMLVEFAKLPFIAVAAIMRFFVGVGQGSIRFVLNSILFLIGFGFIAMLVFGLGRVIFYPLFH